MSQRTRKLRTQLVLISLALMLSACLSESETASAPGAQPDPNPPTNGAPTISGVPASSVAINVAYSFQPTASDPEGDTLTFSVENLPSWASFDSNSGTLSGTPTLGAVGLYNDIVITVSDGSQSSSLSPFSIDVVQTANASMTLNWNAPATNDDGSPLNDLVAYQFYYGTSSGSYSNVIRVNTPGITTYVINNLVPDTYFVVATAINSAGVESVFSNEATKVVQ